MAIVVIVSSTSVFTSINIQIGSCIYLKLPLKLQWANGALSQLRHNIPLKTLVNIYLGICQVWNIRDKVACHRILTLQKCALRLITFSVPRTPSNPIFSNLRVFKIFDLVEILNPFCSSTLCIRSIEHLLILAKSFIQYKGIMHGPS